MSKKLIPYFFFILFLTFVGCSDSDDDDLSSGDLDTKVPYPTVVQNNYPIVLVHGMCGWGRDELFGKFHYWGGTGDIQEDLNSKGYQVFTASMGPLSSNWDRAIELYYCIKGGVVDYGAVHSKKYGHERYGRSYPGLYPEWDENHPIHLIGHSMGGPTPRYLIELLEHGDVQEELFVPNIKESPTAELFKGGRTKWVHSLTTIAGAHDGAMETDDALKYRKLLEDMWYKLAALAGMSSSEFIYDFNLQQWGLERIKGESFTSYWKRVATSGIWETTDNCIYDLSIRASNLQNQYAKSSENVYYASYAADGTEPGPNNTRVPIATMDELLKPICLRTGMNTLDLPLGYLAWRYNDGLVSNPSSNYPFGHKHVLMDPKNRMLAPKGVWDVHPVIQGQDHMSVIIPDQKNSIENIYAFYEQIAKDVSCLPR